LIVTGEDKDDADKFNSGEEESSPMKLERYWMLYNTRVRQWNSNVNTKSNTI